MLLIVEMTHCVSYFWFVCILAQRRSYGTWCYSVVFGSWYCSQLGFSSSSWLVLVVAVSVKQKLTNWICDAGSRWYRRYLFFCKSRQRNECFSFFDRTRSQIKWERLGALVRFASGISGAVLSCRWYSAEKELFLFSTLLLFLPLDSLWRLLNWMASRAVSFSILLCYYCFWAYIYNVPRFVTAGYCFQIVLRCTAFSSRLLQRGSV